MDEMNIVTRQMPGIAVFDNFDEIKAYLDTQLDAYRNLVFSDEHIKTAKADKATLTRLKKALDTRRKEIKSVYMEPYKQIEAQIKELIDMIDKPLADIDGFVKRMEDEEKRQKKETIRAYFDSVSVPLGELAAKVFDAPGFLDPKWLNKTCTPAEWQRGVREKIAQTAQEISAIQTAGGVHTAAVLATYLEGLDMEAATAFRRKMEETAPVSGTAVQPVDDDDRVTGYKVLKITGTRRQMAQIMEQMALMGVEFEELEDGMPGELTELTEPDFDSFVAFDIETSGTFGAANGDGEAEITEIGAVRVINGEIVEKKDWLCNPGRRITPMVSRLTHITDAMVADKPSVSEVIRAFADFVGDMPLVGHNIKSSDLHYIVRAANRAGVRLENPFFDTYLYAKRFKEAQGWQNLQLSYLSAFFGIEQEEAHRAWCDANANASVYFHLKDMG